MKNFILFELIILLEFLPATLALIFGFKILWLLPLIAVVWIALVRAFMREEKERCLYMTKKKYVAASDAAEIISEKLSVSLSDLVDVFAEIPSASLKETTVACSRCGEPMRFPVAFHDAFYELAAGAIMEKLCDEYCRFPCECHSQEELDKHCDNCELVGLINAVFEDKKEKP